MHAQQAASRAPGQLLPVGFALLCAAVQEQEATLSQHDLHCLQPYLQLPSVLAGLDGILQLLLGLRLIQRNPRSCEVWADRVLVLELCLAVHCESSEGDNTATASSRSCRSSANGCSSNGGSSSIDSGNSSGYGGMSDAVLGTIYLDLNAGYAAQLLLYGHSYPFLVRQDSQQQHSKHALAGFQQGPFGSSTSGGAGVGAAVALGLQSGGVLHGQHSQVALGLWELCHEMGHAVNFILSSTSSSSSSDSSSSSRASGDSTHSSTGNSSSCRSANGVQPVGDCAAPPEVTQQQAAAGVYHLHSTWLPVELLELPSTLFEALAMDASTLQLLCRHEGTGAALPAEFAGKLAASMHAAHYSPSLYQRVVSAVEQELLPWAVANACDS
jgi:hypothetical protein